MWRVKAVVKLKEGVLDVQGRAVETALHQLGYEDAVDLRVGKYIEFTAQKKPDTGKLRETAADLLANPVIETIEFNVENLRETP